MTYIYVDYMNNSRIIKKNKALAKMQRDAVICFKDDKLTILADAASPYAIEMLDD